MRTNEWQEMSIACLKPSAEQSMSGPCKSSFGAQAIEWTRMSSWPHSFVILSNTASSMPGVATSSGMKIGAPSSLASGST